MPGDLTPGQQDTADRVRAAALELFARRGFGATGIREISRVAGVSVATLYHYMENKESYLSNLMVEGLQKLLSPALAVARDSLPPNEELSLLVKNHVEGHIERRVESLIADTEIRSLSSKDRAAVVALRDQYQAIWEQTLTRGVAEGMFDVSDIKLATFALLEMNTGIVFWYKESGRLPVNRVVDVFTELSLNLVGFHTKESESTRPRLTKMAVEDKM